MQNAEQTVPTLEFLYTNWKGRTAVRKVVDPVIVYKSSPYHNNGEPGWIMEAVDLEDGVLKDFEMLSIHNFDAIPF